MSSKKLFLSFISSYLIFFLLFNFLLSLFFFWFFFHILLMSYIITLFISITLFYGTNNFMQNILHVWSKYGEYSIEYCQSRITLLWILIMLWSILYFFPSLWFHPSVLFPSNLYCANFRRTWWVDRGRVWSMRQRRTSFTLFYFIN